MHSYMIPERENALLHRLANAAGAADAVDRPQMVGVARLGRLSLVEIHAQAGAEEGLLDVVRGQGVAGKQHVDVAQANHLLEELAAAGVNHGGSGDDQGLAARSAIFGQFAGDSPDGQFLGLLGGDGAAHELERLGLARALFGKDAHSGPSHDDRIAHGDLVHRQTPRSVRRVDHDAAIHLLVLHRNPLASQPNFGPLVRGAVEPFGKGLDDVGRDELAVRSHYRRGTVVGNLGQNSFQVRRVAGPNLDQRVARIGPGLADRDFLDAEGAAARGDAVEDLRQDQTVDDMAADLHVFHVDLNRPRRQGRSCRHEVSL